MPVTVEKQHEPAQIPQVLGELSRTKRGAADPPGEVMEADTVCQTIEELATNKGSEAAVMRVIMVHA